MLKFSQEGQTTREGYKWSAFRKLIRIFNCETISIRLEWIFSEMHLKSSLWGTFRKIINMIPSLNDYNNNHSFIWYSILNETFNLFFNRKQNLIFIHSRFPFPAQHFHIAIIKNSSPQEMYSPDLKTYRSGTLDREPGIIDDR